MLKTLIAVISLIAIAISGGPAYAEEPLDSEEIGNFLQDITRARLRSETDSCWYDPAQAAAIVVSFGAYVDEEPQEVQRQACYILSGFVFGTISHKVPIYVHVPTARAPDETPRPMYSVVCPTPAMMSFGGSFRYVQGERSCQELLKD